MTRSTVAGSARFRQRKLTTKQALQILREDEIDHVDDDGQRNVPKVETGVEKGEEVVSSNTAYLSEIPVHLPILGMFVVNLMVTGTPSASCFVGFTGGCCRWQGCPNLHPHPRYHPQFHSV